MDAFENVIASILHRSGYWTRTSFKVELTKEEKREIGRPSTPRWELDVIGYSSRRQEIIVVECKSYLDSPGVRCDVFAGTNPEGEANYKLFCDETLRRVVMRRLSIQLFEASLCPENTPVQLCLAAGKVYGGDEDKLKQLFVERGWQLWTPSFIRAQLQGLRSAGYENDVATVVAKLLLRESARSSPKHTT